MPYLRPKAAYSRDYAGSTDPGDFGYHTGYWCDECEVSVQEPEEVCTYRGSWEQPPEYEWACRSCGHYGVQEHGKIYFHKVRSRTVCLSSRPVV